MPNKKLNYNLSEIATIIGADTGDNKSIERITITELSLDSRHLNQSEHTLFFAIIGARHNGHHFIDELYQKGIRNFVISDKNVNPSNYKDAYFLRVDNTLDALQKLTQTHREKFSFPVIGITGSNGKTIIKEWLYQLLRNDFNIVKSPKSYNSQVGVPLSVWQIQDEHNLGIFEAGISLPSEMKRLAKIIQPKIGVFTNIGEAHAENFIDNNQKIQEKLLLFESVESLIYCKDYESLHSEILKCKYLSNAMLFTWSRKHNADLLIVKTQKEKSETFLQAIYQNNFISITIPFTDDASIENAINCWCVMLNLECPNTVIAERMVWLSPVAMRLELKQGINNCSIINDSYNSDLGSLAIALDFLNQQNQHTKKTIILSDILQSGKEAEKLYAEVAGMLTNKGVDRIIGIGESLIKNQHLFAINNEFYSSTKEFLDHFSVSKFQNETILLKGARVFKFEQISKLLQQKTHETVLEINLSALVHNVNIFRSKLLPNTKIMAMVKAFSYGSGSFEIANILQYNRVDYLAVAYTDEGVELRKAGITLPIMVMSPDLQSFDNLIKYKLEPEIYSFRMLREFSDAVKANNLSELLIHIKLDTGMHRLGFEENDINELCVRLKHTPAFIVQSVFSHLVASDEAEHDGFTKTQISSYTKMCYILEQHLGYTFIKHILNSAGAQRFTDEQFDMVRLGIGMHGITAVPNQMLIPTIQLKTVISQIKQLKASETVGYSRKGKLLKNTRIATVPIGYADGYSRKLGNGVGTMLINGDHAPTIGNICMDMTMLDISDIEVEEGDEVIVFGEGYPVSKLAQAAQTIPYEILASMSARVKRVYFQE